MANVSAAQKEMFIDVIAPIIQKYAKQYGYKVCSPIIAQACCESNYGASGLAKYHNYFGLKCGSSWKGASVNMKTKEEYTKGTLTTIRDNFRAYSNIEEGVNGYFVFISSKRYSNLKYAATPQTYLEMIRSNGYATSYSYVTTNMNFIKKHNLTRFDNFNAGTQETKAPVSYPLLKVGMNDIQLGAKYIESWQNYLNLLGYKCEVNGCFTESMEIQVMNYQHDHKACGKADGIIGPKTWATIQK